MRHLPRRAFAAALAAVLGASLLGAAGSAQAVGTAPGTVRFAPLWDRVTPVSGPFTVSATVTMGSSQSITVDPGVDVVPTASGRWPAGVNLPGQTVTAADCPVTCTLSWPTFDPTTRDRAWPDGTVQVGATVHDGATLLDYPNPAQAPYVDPVADVALDRTFAPTPTSVLQDYAPSVMDTGGTITVTSTSARPSGETIVADIRSTQAGPSLSTSTATWGQRDATTGVTTAKISLNTATLAEGFYGIYVQVSNAAGQWGWTFYDGLYVRHHPAIEWYPLPDAVLPGTPVQVSVEVSSPLPPWVGPDHMSYAIDGGAPTVLPNSSVIHADPSWGIATIPAAQLPAGIHTIVAQLLDYTGAPVGAPHSMTLPVVTFSDKVTSPPLVVGTQLPVTFKGTAPPGVTYLSCDDPFYDQQGMSPTGPDGIQDACWHTKTINAVRQMIPRVAGPARFELQIETTNYLQPPVEVFPVTVYAKRTASMSAPASSAYGTSVRAVVKVTDQTDMARAAGPAPGVRVTVQRKVAGTTTWTNVGAATTDAYGLAAVTLSNSVNGQLRAVVADAVPGRSLYTAPRPIASLATVAWTHVVTSARSGALTYAGVTAKPTEAGATVRVQAHLIGTSYWITFASVPVTRSGSATPTARLYSRGTWEVRVQRVATVLHTSSYSTVRRITVY